MGGGAIGPHAVAVKIGCTLMGDTWLQLDVSHSGGGWITE